MKQIEVVAAIIRMDDKIFATQRGYKWNCVSEDYMEWTPQQYRDMLHHPKAERQFHNDIEAMEALSDFYPEIARCLNKYVDDETVRIVNYHTEVC